MRNKFFEAVAKDLSTPQPRQAQIDKSWGKAPKLIGAPETAAQTHAVLRARSAFDISQDLRIPRLARERPSLVDMQVALIRSPRAQAASMARARSSSSARPARWRREAVLLIHLPYWPHRQRECGFEALCRPACVDPNSPASSGVPSAR